MENMKKFEEKSESMESPSEPSSSSSSVSADLGDDATPYSSSTSSSSGALYEFADLMAHLPIKRGLSEHYDGKSESFASLTSVRRVEDLEKKEMCYSKRMKWCKSYNSNFNLQKLTPKAKATIAKTKRSPNRTLTCIFTT